jgi:hypothetical protein
MSAAAVTLAACYVLPIDPRTGAPVYPAPITHSHDPTRASVTAPAPIVLPTAPPALSTYTARLYPLNEQANRGGLLVAQVSDAHTGRGSFSLNYRGQLMQGDATRVDAGHPGFGRIHNDALGLSATRAFAGRRGVANAFGGQGVNAQCEYVITGPSQGTGACVFSDGAKYQMHFGN